MKDTKKQSLTYVYVHIHVSDGFFHKNFTKILVLFGFEGTTKVKKMKVSFLCFGKLHEFGCSGTKDIWSKTVLAQVW